MDESSFLEELRKIRGMEKLNLKPSPFLRSNFSDNGIEKPVVLREYQKKHIFEMLQVTRHLNGSDAGLGKTLETLTTIGYVWMKEPEYVPIILTRKSALYQWGEEVKKFMQNMETVTIDGDPYERVKMYEKFFNNHDSNKKTLLIMTYETLLKDFTQSAVRDTKHKANSADKKAFALAKKTLKEIKTELCQERKRFESWFSDRPYDIWNYANSLIEPAEQKSPPFAWSQDDLSHVEKLRSLIEANLSWEKEVTRLGSIVHPTIVTSGISGHIEEFFLKNPNSKMMLVMDEAHVVKNYRGKIHAVVADLSKFCERVYGLTATPIKNRLMEFFSILRIIVPNLFPKITWFQNEFCVTKLQRIGGGRSVPIVVGYKNLNKFVEKIEPYYLSKRKHEVAKELPKLVTRELQCELTDLQESLYDLAESGLLEKDADPDSSSAAVLGAMTFVQEAVNSPKLLNNEEGEPYDGPSPKVDALLELLEDELSGVKTIVFSRFERMISLIEETLNLKKIKCVRITGKENKASDREKAKTIFQDPNSGVDVILITEAGSESINLQAAEHFILVDSPWSFGTYIQLIGRMIRIGSQHSMVVATHLVAVHQSKAKTIDHHVLDTLRDKMKLSNCVSGEALPDGLKFTNDDFKKDVMKRISESKTQKKSKDSVTRALTLDV